MRYKIKVVDGVQVTVSRRKRCAAAMAIEACPYGESEIENTLPKNKCLLIESKLRPFQANTTFLCNVNLWKTKGSIINNTEELNRLNNIDASRTV